MSRQLQPLQQIPAWRRGWTRYHLAVVSLFAAMIFGASLRAVLVMNGGGWQTEVEIELPWSAEALWPLVSSAEGRVTWQAGASDIIPLMKQDAHVGTTHSIWYIKHPDTWRGTETTMKWVPGRLFASYSNSEKDERNFSVELSELGPCLTRIVIRENTMLKRYRDRYFALWESRDEDDRAERSLDYLVKEAARQLPACKG